MSALKDIFSEIEEERKYQDKLWGHEEDDKHTVNDWVAFITMYAGKAIPIALTAWEQRKFILKVASLAIAALEAYERNQKTFPPRHYEK